MIEKHLLKLWEQFRGTMQSERLNEILERGICYSRIEKPHRILVTGINPSFRQGDEACKDFVCRYSFQDIVAGGEDRYFLGFAKLFPRAFRQEVAYLDILNLRETEQNVVWDFIRDSKGLALVAENLKMNQLYIEQVIRPRLIVVKNKGSWGLWGKDATGTENFWMGYRFEYMETLPCGELCRISGLWDHPDRVASRELLETNLKGTLVLFTSHFQYCSAEKRPSPELMERLCKML